MNTTKEKTFWGRAEELRLLNNLKKKPTPSLVTITGRRRIGKSRLVKEFAKSSRHFYEFQGLYPNPGITQENQLAEFAEDLNCQLNAPQMRFENWTQAFRELAQRTQNQECVILLDEISWMSAGDKLFSSQLQKAWNLEFSKNPKLVLIICGSVSSWIEDNIVNNANFAGRVSLQINLKELSLSESNHFWDFQKDSKISSYEKLKILSITGGVPKYLEELVKKGSTENSIIKNCFHESGILYNEFDKIFSEIFMRKAPALERIIRKLIEKKYQPTNLASALDLNLNSFFSNQLEMLILSGFCEKDASYLMDGEQSKLSWIRLKDNYLRFYLNYIEPLKGRIDSQSTKIQTLDQLKNWDCLLGLQFENVILNSRSSIFPFLDLDSSDVLTASPYFQKKSTRTKGAAQVDLLIHSRRDVFFLCEFKCVRQVDRSIIAQVKKKMNVIKIPKRAALRPVLIYEGQIHPNDKAELKDFFDTIIHFGELLK